MTASMVSTSSQSFLQRSHFSKLQVELESAQVEMSTGRIADVSRSLGASIGPIAVLDSRIQSFAVLAQSNEVVKGRLATTELALAGLNDVADTFRGVLISARNGVSTPAQLSAAAVQALDESLSVMNTAYGGQFVFSGAELRPSGVSPGNDLSGRVLEAVADNFMATFGFKPDDSAVSSLPSENIQQWLESGLPELFDEPAFGALLSVRGGPVPLARIGENEHVSAGVSSDAPAFRKLFMSFISAALFGGSELGDNARASVVDGASRSLEEGAAGLVSVRSKIGSVIQRIDASSESLRMQTDLFRSQVSEFVETDAFETAVRIESLRSRLEASYSITARMSRVSLMNYL